MNMDPARDYDRYFSPPDEKDSDSNGDSEGEKGETGSSEETGSGSTATSEEDEEGEDEEDDEPVLKYKRFAKDVVARISEASDGPANLICSMAVHPKVNREPCMECDN